MLELERFRTLLVNLALYGESRFGDFVFDELLVKVVSFDGDFVDGLVLGETLQNARDGEHNPLDGP